EAVRIPEIERFPHEVVGSTESDAGRRQMADEAPEVRSVGQQDREVIETEQPAAWHRAGVRLFLQNKQRLRLSRRNERSTAARLRASVQSEDGRVVRQAAIEAGHLQARRA